MPLWLDTAATLPDDLIDAARHRLALRHARERAGARGPSVGRSWHTGDPRDPDRRRRPGRPEQKLPPPVTPAGVEWLVWLILAGRGFGKTRAGAEATIDLVQSGEWRRPALVGQTAADVRDVMVLGPSGILACSPPAFTPTYIPGQRRLVWPNGAEALLYSAERPDRLRGPGHDGAWVDELAAWRYLDSYEQVQFVLREGRNPRLIATTTPRPIRLIRELVTEPTTYVTRGTTYDNLENLPPSFARRVVARYEGTRLGRQELYAEILDDLEGAYWTLALIDAARVRDVPRAIDGRPLLARVVVAVDPAGRSGDENDQTGLAVAGRGLDGHLYVLAAEGVRLSPRGWASRALDLYDEWAADKILAERNNGGDMVEATIRSVRLTAPVETIHASRGKVVRAEPVAALYEQGRVSHVGRLDALEQQQCFPAETVVDAPDLVAALRRLYTGELIEVDTTRGTLVGTPNHPVLTENGWDALETIRPGSRLYYADALPGRDAPALRHRRPIGDVHAALPIGRDARGDRGRDGIEPAVRQVPGLPWSRGIPSDLRRPHRAQAGALDADGAGLRGRDRRRRGLGRLLAEPTTQQGQADRSRRQHLDGATRLAAPAPGRARRPRDAADAAGEQSVDVDARRSGAGLPPALRGAAAAPDRQAAADDARRRVDAPAPSRSDPAADDPARVRAGRGGRAPEPARVTAVRRRAVSALPVYNLRTERGWYVADGVIVHNCSFPVDPDAGDDLVDAAVYALTALVEPAANPLAGVVAVGRARGWQPRRAG